MKNAAMLSDASMRKLLYGSVKKKLNVSAPTTAIAIAVRRPPIVASSGGSSSTRAIVPVFRSSRNGYIATTSAAVSAIGRMIPDSARLNASVGGVLLRSEPVTGSHTRSVLRPQPAGAPATSR